MQINVKSLILWISLALNTLFLFLIIAGSITKTASFSFPYPSDEETTMAVISSFPKSGSAVFNVIEVNLSVRQKTSFQYSIFSEGKQANLLINALYDPAIISVTQTGYGIIITALSKGATIMQMVTIDGIKDIAFITVE